jgi:hypothetical protein
MASALGDVHSTQRFGSLSNKVRALHSLRVIKTAMAVMMARYKLTNHWFVSVETPKLLFSSAPRPRETKSFPTEIEAKQFAMAMLSEGRKVTAGTLMPHQPIRRTIPASEINQWIGEEETALGKKQDQNS